MTHKCGNQVLNILGVEVELIAGTLVTKRDAQRVLQWKLDIDPRQSRSAVNSYIGEGWTEGRAGQALRFDAPLCYASSLEARIWDHLERRAEASRENGCKGGRPKSR